MYQGKKKNMPHKIGNIFILKEMLTQVRKQKILVTSTCNGYFKRKDFLIEFASLGKYARPTLFL